MKKKADSSEPKAPQTNLQPAKMAKDDVDALLIEICMNLQLWQVLVA